MSTTRVCSGLGSADEPAPSTNPSAGPTVRRAVERKRAVQREARLLTVLAEVPRHLFFPEGVDRGFPNEEPVPLRGERTIPPVALLAKMLRALELDGTELVLDVSGGSGYQAALLSHLAREVISLETDAELASRAASLFEKLGRSNVQLVRADGWDGWRERAPYQAILVGAAAPELPVALVEQLDLGGRLVIGLGDDEGQLIQRMRKRCDGLDSETIGACKLDLLPMQRRIPSAFPWAGHHGQ